MSVSSASSCSLPTISSSGLSTSRSVKNLSAIFVCRPDATSCFDLSAACGSAYPCVYSVDGRSPWPKIVTQRRQPFDSAFDLFADRTVPVLLMSTLCARRLLCRRPAPIVYMRLGGWRWRGCYHPHSHIGVGVGVGAGAGVGVGSPEEG